MAVLNLLNHYILKREKIKIVNLKKKKTVTEGFIGLPKKGIIEYKTSTQEQP